MKVVVGLGNPGSQYTNTRHNAGMMIVDKMAEKQESDYGWRRKKDIFRYEAKGMALIKSADIFMNESGRMVQGINSKELYLAHDDLDLRLGSYKIQYGVGPKVHHGVQSVETALRTNEFWRIRIGIDSRTVPVDGETYVLQPFNMDERKVLEDVFDKIIEEIVS